MNTLRAALVVSTICLFVSCGGSGTGGTGGSGGSSGGATGTAGASGAAGAGGGGGGTTGTGTGGGGGGLADCPACVACVMANCASQVASCQATASCRAIYECGRTCTTPINTCVAQNLDALQTWGSTVAACINASCATPCATL